jgi:hypothetical protein
MSELAPWMSWSTTLPGILTFSLRAAKRNRIRSAAITSTRREEDSEATYLNAIDMMRDRISWMVGLCAARKLRGSVGEAA